MKALRNVDSLTPYTVMMMNQKFLSVISAIMFMVMLSGCAATADGRKTQAQGTAIGAGLGAVAGALIGYAAGGRQGLVTGAAIGAGTGAVAGFAYGTHVAKMKAKYASREAWLDACIASARKVNSNAYSYSRSLESRIAKLESRTRAAKSSGNKSQAKALKREIAQVKAEARVKEDEVSKELTSQSNVSSDGDAKSASNYGSYKSEVNNLQQTKGTLGRQVNRLAGLENQLDV